jgi:hypothetical protein
MTLAELAELGYFRDGERFLNGQVIDWATIDAATMRAVAELRRLVDAPVHLIRGAHPNRPSAVDGCCPSVPLAAVFLALTRLQGCSWGIYSGCSFHVDMRAFERVPARWLAVKEREEHLLKTFGLDGLVTGRKDGWIYLAYGPAASLEAVTLICRLAEGQRQPSAG